MIPTLAAPAESTRCCVGGPVFYGPVMASSRGRASILSFIDLFKFVVPEEQPVALIKEDVEGGVAGVSPPLDDRALPAAQVRGAMVFPNPYPFAYARFLGPHGDLTSREFECRRFARGIPGSPFGCSQSKNALPSGSRNIACFPLGVSVGGNSKATPLKRSSSWIISMSSVESTMTRYMPGSMKDDQVTSISEVAEFFGATSDQCMPSLQELSTSNSKPNVPT